jgi:hypothetical protein
VNIIGEREGRAKAFVTGTRRLDAQDNPATGVALSDNKDLPSGVSGEGRPVEFMFPIDNSIIQSGTWDFTIRIASIDAMGNPEPTPMPWETTCSIILRQDGLNRLDAQESQAACTGDFVRFSGDHEVGIDDVRLEPQQNRVGARPTIKVTLTNSGASQETVDIDLNVYRMGARVFTGTKQVVDLQSGETRTEPTNNPQITWDTSGLSAGDYEIEAKLRTPIMGDRTPLNDRLVAGVTLNAGDTDGDGFFDELDNCPMVANPLQENCDGQGPGDACDVPRISSFRPDCAIGGDAVITVLGFGFGNLSPTDITLGTASAAAIVRQSACQLEFRNPATNPNPWGRLRIATIPPIEAPTCCVTPKIDDFNPSDGVPDTVVTVLGCGLAGAQVFLEPTVAGGQPIGPIALESGSTADILRFRIPASVIRNAEYTIRLSGTAAPGFSIRSTRTFRVRQ